MTTVHRQQTNHQELTIIRGKKDFHSCSGNRSLILLVYTTSQFVRKQKENLLIDILKHWERQPPFPYQQLYYVLATDLMEKTNIGIDCARGASRHLFVYLVCMWFLRNKEK